MAGVNLNAVVFRTHRSFFCIRFPIADAVLKHSEQIRAFADFRFGPRSGIGAAFIDKISEKSLRAGSEETEKRMRLSGDPFAGLLFRYVSEAFTPRTERVTCKRRRT